VTTWRRQKMIASPSCLRATGDGDGAMTARRVREESTPSRARGGSDGGGEGGVKGGGGGGDVAAVSSK
jgi:hypothetical protein